MMMKPRMLVTGATGKTGSVVAAELLNAGYPVRAMVHREDRRSERLRSLGAEIVVAEMSDVERVVGALHDVQRAYYCPPLDPYAIQGAAAFAVAAKEARLEHIVGLTQWLSSPSHPSLMTRQSWLIDHLFSMIPGVAHTIINPGFFADVYLMPLALATNIGLFPWVCGDSRNAPPSNEDIARVAASVLMNPERHNQKSYRPTGPQLLGGKEMAEAIGRAIGRHVRVVPASTALFLKSARLSGVPVDIMSNVRYYLEDHRQGAFECGAPTTDVLELTGRPSEDFETIARRYAAYPHNQRTLRNWLVQFTQFLLAPLTPGFKFNRYNRSLRSPFPSAPRLATESGIWRDEHDVAQIMQSMSA
jgi:NAD(P)H dehydrogenase (quinone)